MPSVTCFNIRFTPSWLMIFLAVLFIALFTRLGVWQIQRAEEKKQILKSQELWLKKQPSLWEPNGEAPHQHQRLILKGHYLKTLFLLDNQHHQHQFGYDVVSPLQLEDGSIVMVDRGWVLGDLTRKVLPQVVTPKKFLSLQGSVYYPAKNSWVLGEELEEKGDSYIIERLDTKLLSQILQKKVYPFIIRLDKQEAHGFVREWAIISMPPQRHLAYALQWFAMALVILIIFLALNLKKKNEKMSY